MTVGSNGTEPASQRAAQGMSGADDLFSQEGTLNDAREQGDGTGEVITNDRCKSDMPMTVNAYAIQPETRSFQ